MTDDFSPERSAAIRRLLVAEVVSAPVRAERATSRISLIAASGTLLLIVVLVVVGASVTSVRSTVASLFHGSSSSSSSAGVSPTVVPSAPVRDGPEAGAGVSGPDVPVSGTNDRGQSFGPAIAGRGLPQLVAVVGRTAGGKPVAGYVTRSDYVATPVQTSVPLFRSDGTTVIGTWTVTRHG
jgi:hypothetical protein